MHDGIRQQQVEAGVPALIASSLKSYQRGQEEVLWAALFSLAVLIREGGQPYTLSMTAAVDSGLLPLLKVALQDHEVGHAEAVIVLYTQKCSSICPLQFCSWRSRVVPSACVLYIEWVFGMLQDSALIC